jgi:hypothetical protein
MSVVVWDGVSLAADRQITNIGLRMQASKMLATSDGTLSIGTLEGQHLVSWGDAE